MKKTILQLPVLQILIMALAMVTISSCSSGSKDHDSTEANNGVKLGKAEIEVVCQGDVPEDLSAIVGVSSIFDRTFESEEFRLENDGQKRLYGNIELETPEAIGALMLFDDTARYALGYVELSQNQPLKIDVEFKDGQVVNITKSNTNGVNANPFMVNEDSQDVMLTDAAYYVASPGTWISEDMPKVNPEDLDNVATALEKLDSLRTYIVDAALHGREIPTSFNPWFLTHLNNMVYGNYYLGYRENFETEGRELPIEFFRFLNDIDFDQLLRHDVVTGPNYIMRKMLSSPDLGLSPIGEIPVAQWQADTKASLSRVMDNVPQLLLDLLSATSYMEQINANKPLTQTQIDNINSGYSDDLGKLVLKSNEELVSALGGSAHMVDLSEQEFVLQDYIDANFKGRPVVVDTWNTWCMPCLEAHKNVEPLRELKESEGVVFLYVSDTSSKYEDWQKVALRVGGEQVRISEDSRDKMGATYNLQAFPSYLFFDADHNLKQTVTAYPGDDKFLELIKSVNPQK